MGVFCDRVELGSTVALDCWTGQNKDIYRESPHFVISQFVIPAIS